MLDNIWLNETYNNIETKINAQAKRIGNKIPYIPQNGFYTDKGEQDIAWWTNGFWAGIMWQMYNATKNELYLQKASIVEERLDIALNEFEGLHHDVGFMYLHTSVANYKLTNNSISKKRALHAANLLAGRFNPQSKYIRAWNNHLGYIIIDCLMNLPLLHWASNETKDPRFKAVASAQTDIALNFLLREDGSCNHIADIDPVTGECIGYPAGQGSFSGSSWSRGQSWAVYGFALNYYYTKDIRYLNASKKAAHYFIANISNTDYIPAVDFRDMASNDKIDVSAGLIAACGLLFIADLCDESDKNLYLLPALKILKQVCKHHVCWDINKDSLVQNCTVAFHGTEGTHIPLIYADYFLIEAILKLKGKSFLIW